MKKFFTLAATALVAFSANAELNFMTQPSALTMPKKVAAVKAPAQMKKAPAQKQDVDDAFEAFLGDFVHSQWALDADTYTDWISSNTGMQITDNGDGTVTMSNFLGFGDIVATYDADDEALYAEAGQFLFQSSYGSVGLFPIVIDDEGEAQYSEDELCFMLDDENRFELLNDGVMMLLTDGAYAGYMLNYFYLFNQFDRVNGTMSWLDYNEEEVTVGVAIEDKIEKSGYINVYGFSDLGCAMLGVEGDEVQLYNEQGLFFHGNYGLFTNVGCTIEDGNIYLAEGDYTAGTLADGVISLDPFCVACGNTLYDLYENATITLPKEDTPVAISSIKTENVKRAFDLQGRVADKFEQGQVYMQEGRKFIVK